MRAVDPVRIVVCAGTPAQQSATKKWTNRRMVESTPGGILRPRHSTVPRRLFDAECLGDGPDTSSRTTIPVLPAGIPSRINGRPTGPGSGVRTTGRMGANPGRRHPGDLTRRCSHRAGLAIPARNRRDSLLPGGGMPFPSPIVRSRQSEYASGAWGALNTHAPNHHSHRRGRCLRTPDHVPGSRIRTRL